MSALTLRQRLRDDELVLAAMVTEFATPAIVTMMSTAGVDSIFLDAEHSTFDWPSIAATIALGDRCGVHVAVRVPEIRREPIQKVLDAGAHALVVPMVDTVDQARHVVQLAKYPPEGERGVALRRAHSRFVTPDDPAEYMRRANDRIAIMVQIETEEAVRAAEQIAGLDGIDALFVGPSDLSASAGAPGQVWTEESRTNYAHVLAAARKHDKSAAIHVTDLTQAAELVAEGFRYVSMATDVSALVDTVAAGVTRIRSELTAKVETKECYS